MNGSRRAAASTALRHLFSRTRPVAALLLLGGVGGVFFTPRAARAQITVTPTITNNGTTFTYSYSVFNGSGVDLSLIQFQTIKQQNALTNLQAPLGFDINFDPGNGFVTFFEDNDPNTTQSFAPNSTIAPFTFDSAFGPAETAFSGLDDNGGGFAGTTMAPSVMAVPEPGTLPLLGLTLAPGLLLASRRHSTARRIS